MNQIKRLKNKLAQLKAKLNLQICEDDRWELEYEIDSVEDEIRDLEDDHDPEDIYKVLGHNDTPSLDTNLNY